MSKFVSYMSPIQRDCRTPDFALASERRLQAVVTHARALGGVVDDGWARMPGLPHAALTQAWRPKLYACVAGDAYWRTIDRLLPRLERARVRWRFWCRVDGCERPDKIVVYPYASDAATLRRTVAVLRDALAGVRTHSLHHAALASEVGLEDARADGVYVGLDPVFLERSWRWYRCLASAWLLRHRASVREAPGGLAGWLERMNLSRTHQGPASLEPDPKHLAFVARTWRAMTASPAVALGASALGPPQNDFRTREFIDRE